MTDEVSMLRLLILQTGGYPLKTKAYLTLGKLASYLLGGQLEAPAHEKLCMK